MNLYLLSTKRLGDFYVLAESPNDAEFKLSESLSLADYGFDAYRKVDNIKLVAEEIMEFPKGRPNFASGKKLIISNPAPTGDKSDEG